jgi:hypothetical protein
MKPDGFDASSPATDVGAKAQCHCPKCGALLYSRRSRLCDQCGTVLPRELVLTDAQAEVEEQERQWARDLAEKFDTTGHKADHAPRRSRRPQPPPAEPTTADLTDLEAQVQRLSCASAFKYRERRTWLFVIGFALTTFPAAFLMVSLGGMPVMAWLVLIGFSLFLWFRLWRRAAPICPNCKMDIRTCPAMHCHVCGKPLSQKRCTDCGVDSSWIGWLRPNQSGAFHWIQYCPGCGVELDTSIPRWHPGQRG